MSGTPSLSISITLVSRRAGAHFEGWNPVECRAQFSRWTFPTDRQQCFLDEAQAEGQVHICALVLSLFAIVGCGTRSKAQGSPPAAPITVTPQFNFGISVRDAEKTAHWYEENLGLTRTKSGTFPSGKFIILGSPRLSVEIIQDQSAIDPRKQLNVTHDYLLQGVFKIGLYVDDLDATVARLKQRNVRIEHEHGTDEELHLRFAIVFDGDGNTIQLFENKPRIRPTIPAGIEKLHQDDVAATLTGDLEALTALWDDEGVLLQPGHSPIVGKTALREFLKQTLAQSASTKVLKYAPDIRDVQVECDTAYEWDSSIRPSDRPIARNPRISVHAS